MASATGTPADTSADRRTSEDEPLLGRAGDASQQQGKPIYYNFVLGTGIIAQAGIWILAAIVWSAVLSKKIILFTYHPLLNSLGLVLIVQAVLVLQPTHTAKQKVTGTYIHSALNNLGFIALIAGLAVILINKADHGGHFESVHARLGLITYIFMVLQVAVGASMFFLPQLYGGEGRAKSIWKYHRGSGYVLLVLSLATVSAATQTGFNLDTLHIKLWAVLVASVLVLAGVIPRVKKQKLGL